MVVLEIYKDKLKALHGYFEGAADAVDSASAQKAIDYKADVCKKYINLSADQIDLRLSGSVYYATRKVDGEMNVLFLDNDAAAIINRSGRVRVGLPCVEDARKALNAAGIMQGIFPAELHVDEAAGRTRISDVLSVLADKNKISTLRLAVFDILELDNQAYKPESYEETHSKIVKLFSNAEMCAPVKCEKVECKAQVKELFKQWVEAEGAEGLVVRSELPLVFKIKPRYTIDVAVVGFSEGTGDAQGQIRCLLLAMLTSEGFYQVIGKTGGGFSDEARAEILERLRPMIVESQYIETDSNHTAFHMIRPEVIIELMVNDVIFETTSGPVNNAYLTYTDSGYVHKANRRGLSMIYPIFVRFRDDKKAVYEDIRIEQINEFSYIEPLSDSETVIELAKSELISRQVYKKESGSKLMVQKFLLWKTNKENAGYPAYVFHYTNFSSDRKDPLKRDVCVSDDLEQIRGIFESSIDENVKKGWEYVKAG